MATALAEPTGNLLFQWGPRRRRRRSIVSFLIASLVLHAFGFYLFQITYPPTVAPPLPASRVSVISPTTEEGRILLRWLEAEDPAVASMTQRPAETKAFQPPEVQHVPSYLGHRTAIKPASPLPSALRDFSAQPTGPVPRHRPRVVTATSVTATTLSFSAELAAFGQAVVPEMHFTSGGNESPQVASFRVAVSAAGAIQYSILEHSSGDSALDEQARAALALARFPSREQDTRKEPALTWGTADIQWGNDVSPARRASAGGGPKTP